MGVVLHKDSKWSEQWKEFKDNNVVFNRKWATATPLWGRGKGWMGVGSPCAEQGAFSLSLPPPGFFEMKMKYDESDNVLIRASRAVTDKVTGFIGGSILLSPH